MTTNYCRHSTLSLQNGKRFACFPLVQLFPFYRKTFCILPLTAFLFFPHRQQTTFAAFILSPERETFRKLSFNTASGCLPFYKRLFHIPLQSPWGLHNPMNPGSYRPENDNTILTDLWIFWFTPTANIVCGLYPFSPERETCCMLSFY